MATTITANGINFPDGSASAPSIGGTDTNTGLFTGSDIIGFATGGLERIRIDANGNLSLGTTSPNSYTDQRVLTINGTTYGRLDLEVAGTLRGSIWANSGGLGIDAGANDIEMFTGSQQRMVIDSSGRVIIGDDHTNNAFAGGDSLIIGNEDNGTRSGITLVSASNTDGGLYFSRGGSSNSEYVKGQIVYNHLSDYMAFYTSGTKRALDILSSGDVCIGRTSQLSNAKVTIQCDAAEAGIAVQLNASAGTSNLIQAYSSAGPNVASICVNPDGTPDLLFKLYDGSNTVERLRILSSGKVLIGTTNTAGIHSQSGAVGLRIKSGAIGSNYGEGVISLMGTGGDFYAMTMRDSANNGWGLLPIFSSSVDRLSFGYYDAESSPAVNKTIFSIYENGNAAILDGNLEVANGHGINFSATANSGGANIQELFNDYESGRFTPKVYYGTGTSEPNYSWRYGHYVKVGRQVTVWFNLGITGFNPSPDVDEVYIANLPFQNDDPDGQWKYLNLMYGYSNASGWGFSSDDKQMFLAFYDEKTKIRIVKSDGAHINTADVGSGQRWSSSFSYSTDS